MEIKRLSIVVQTHYAELLQQLLNAAADGSTGRHGTFVTKVVRGRTYWYLQFQEVGKQRQVYLGPDTPEIRDLMERTRARWESDAEVVADRARLCAMAAAGGAYQVAGAELAVLKLLSTSGVFQLGGVLVGSHAFATYGNMLGVVWDGGMLRTRDVDVAHDVRIAVAMAEDVGKVDLRGALDADEGGLRFMPIPMLNRKHPSTSFRVRGSELYLDLLTPLVGKPREGPIEIPVLNAAATPLRFLDYLIQDSLPAAVIGGDGVLVNVPAPARFVLHKLLVATRRDASRQAKVAKDLQQATALAEVLLADRPGDLALAWDAAAAHSKKLAAGVRAGLQRIDASVAARLTAAGVAA